MVQLETILSLLGSALSIWDNHEKTYFVKKYMNLKKEFYLEKNKDMPDSAVLDNLEFELQLLVNGFNSKIAGSTPQNMPK